MSFLKKVLSILGKITDLLLIGRSAGLYTEKPTIPVGGVSKGFPDIKPNYLIESIPETEVPITVPVSPKIQFSYFIAAQKMFRTALLACLAIFVSSGGIDTFFNTITTGIQGLSLPVWMVPAIVSLLTLARTFIKQWLNRKVPDSLAYTQKDKAQGQ